MSKCRGYVSQGLGTLTGYQDVVQSRPVQYIGINNLKEENISLIFNLQQLHRQLLWSIVCGSVSEDSTVVANNVMVKATNEPDSRLFAPFSHSQGCVVQRLCNMRIVQITQVWLYSNKNACLMTGSYLHAKHVCKFMYMCNVNANQNVHSINEQLLKRRLIICLSIS